jgi:hypothetical protein
MRICAEAAKGELDRVGLAHNDRELVAQGPHRAQMIVRGEGYIGCVGLAQSKFGRPGLIGVERGIMARLSRLGKGARTQPAIRKPSGNFGQRQIQRRAHRSIPLLEP